MHSYTHVMLYGTFLQETEIEQQLYSYIAIASKRYIRQLALSGFSYYHIIAIWIGSQLAIQLDSYSLYWRILFLVMPRPLLEYDVNVFGQSCMHLICNSQLTSQLAIMIYVLCMLQLQSNVNFNYIAYRKQRNCLFLSSKLQCKILPVDHTCMQGITYVTSLGVQIHVQLQLQCKRSARGSEQR